MTAEPVVTVGSATLRAAAAAISELAREVGDSPEADRPHGFRHLLRADVHDVVMRCTVDGEDADPQDLRELADAVRKHVPEGAEAGLNPRVEVFVRLLREDAFDAAWTLAHDNASGVLHPSRPQATWAGGSNLTSQLALPTFVDGEHVYAWLPGFRDPRWAVPDHIYDLTERVVLRANLDTAQLQAGGLRLSGQGYLGLLVATTDDEVTIELRGPNDARVEVPAVRMRRPELVHPKGPALTRLAWGGWSARVDLGRLSEQPGSWRAHLRVVQQGVRRQRRLGTTRGPLVAADLPTERYVWQGCTYQLTSDGTSDALIVKVGRLPPVSRRLIRRTRGVLRRAVPGGR
ncbi:hypothetical protein [uncultured Jatrophihabitans sp.]|uniref:hypothetical protein n=1 Tax=uncultured Jatrophihabitans sp. TaxID=1610747 RepID=UPI0035CBFE62